MEQIFIVMLIALGVLAIIDLTVGVSNDAVNFLNSALGSKAVTFRTIMIVASLGILVGALFSGGMMEIARSGIFVPSMFSFNDVMVIFLAVMITDVLLLDVFNSMGLPTSTTVSIVFELLGSAVCLAVIKIMANNDSWSVLPNYINTEKATEIVVSILLSVILSFTLGTLVQYISRLIFTFQVEQKLKYFGAIFGGVAITAITFFILVKGLKGASFITKETSTWIGNNQLIIIGLSLVFWTIFSQFLMSIFKLNILRVIIVIGTFALALAFAGNDLVNFIGVPIAAYQSFGFFMESGQSPDTYMMAKLAEENVVAPFYFLAIAGIVMVYTLWTSKKAKNVIETEMSLARQDTGGTAEKFSPNILSKVIVRGMVLIGMVVDYFLPKSLQLKMDKRFEIPKKPKNKAPKDEPAFDMVRASVNLIVASILISIGTSMKLPLSTTYVTFMVAMGTSFADRAWDRDSAVYRVAGVFNVIGGWFVTAIVAFIASFVIAYVLKIGEIYALVGMLILVGILLYRSNKSYIKKSKEKEDKDAKLDNVDIQTIQGVASESSSQIATVITKANELFTVVIDGVALQDITNLKKSKKQLKKLEKEVDDLRGNVYFFIKNLDETSVEASKFYVLTLGYLQDMIKAINFIAQNSYTHVDNNHKKLKFNQIRDLKLIDKKLQILFDKIVILFTEEKFSQIDEILSEKEDLIATVDKLIQKQIIRIRTTETSPKNSKLYFSILFETDELIKSTIGLLELFKDFDIDVKRKSFIRMS
ncbi:inorganic phosphate transporter [Myroides marinus]|jgi:phosphate/sulfate permease|uniref:Phosphate transporter n=1 Tax=Myroides marinus TaxID=703342 RepID=A0A1H6TCY8_9FLAO|nr:inorganic phosphate transporter [Myroides marinus]MDR0196032.1 inorganic phosphate transporter [Myroides sp.]KUF41965.1 phosphate:sodium symporter [Myroides marinus]MDM1347444.1 inorganic phosphate transporter [Myroides marinus]MDM1351047.1 inorganic phosphate transporter [Myroides marinus]MDM1355285.1 inorganic phosphate transporter [Myroides marinus]